MMVVDNHRLATGWVNRKCWQLTLVTALLVLGSPCYGFSISSIEAQLESHQQLKVTVQAKIELSPAIIQALEASIPIKIQTTISIYRVRKRIWDKQIHEYVAHDEIRYRSLYRTYQLKTTDANINGEYQSIDRLLEVLGQRRTHLVALNDGELDPEASYVGKFRIKVARSELPSVMRIPVFFKSSWRLKSRKVAFDIQ